jgi:hypothetical protein
MITFPLTDSKSRSSAPALDPPRRRSCKYAFATSTSPSIFLAYRRFPHLRRTNHAPQRRQPTHSSASVALTHLRRAQTSIALGARGATACHFPRVPSLKAFGRRPRCKPHRRDRPASETLNISGLMHRSEQRLYSITSSARVSSMGGMVRPSALAVLRFSTSSNLVGCWMGRSAGFAPFRMASTWVAARRLRSVVSGP